VTNNSLKDGAGVILASIEKECIAVFALEDSIKNGAKELIADLKAKNIIPILLNAVASSGIVLIPLLFGMWKKTTTSTIVSGVILTSLICSNGNGISLSQILPATLSIGGIGVLIAYLTIKNIENVDVV